MNKVRNEGDWWALVDTNWQALLNIFEKVGAPMGRSEEDHWWSDRHGIASTYHEKCLTQTLEELRSSRDGRALSVFFNKAWDAVHPDNSRCHEWEGWGVLCDLCSENWVLYEEITTEEDVAHGRHPSEGTA